VLLKKYTRERVEVETYFWKNFGLGWGAGAASQQRASGNRVVQLVKYDTVLRYPYRSKVSSRASLEMGNKTGLG